ncbi:hypothetical protein DBR43_11570 [Pedobacter sp. KBW06]|uniref:FecR family protein n=1 Tax=Pedobacter sp. KBW06 TaxID=2153359 RepID=UPI000F5B2593|nr:FecR domain-containing protein [Pedobacter sp. KBW06]RQO71865.1 hypothetical protein DBR43_11570 [Pedobacter sp. KBW06]
MNQINPEILKRYANGNCPPKEQLLVEAWLSSEENESPEQGAFAGIDREGLKQELWADLNPAFSRLKLKYQLPTLIYKVAATLTLISFVAYFGYRHTRQQQEKQSLSAALTYKELVVPKGSKAKITLTDGTEINLNADSRLKYPVAFTGNSRTIYLSGEAHFKVVKDPSKPFVIHTQKTDTRVLGTVFNLKAYPGDHSELLTVEEGKVQFSIKSNPTKPLILTRDQQGILNADGKLDREHVYAAAYSSWKSAKLRFNDLSLAEISILLNREYNIEVETKSKSLRKKRFTGTYQNSALNSIVRDISLALHCQYQLNNRSLIFY